MTATPLISAQASPDVLRRQLILRMRRAALTGDTHAWESLLTELVRHEQGALDEALTATAFHARLRHHAQRLLGLWLEARPSCTSAELPDLQGHSVALPEALALCSELLIAELAAAATCAGLPSANFARRFRLDAIELCLLLLAWLVHIDPTFRDACAYATQGSAHDPELFFGILFGMQGPLWSLGRLRLHPMAPLRLFALSQASLHLPEAVKLALDGVTAPAAELVGVADWVAPVADASPLALDEVAVTGLERLLSLKDDPRPARVILTASRDAGRRAHVLAAAARLGRFTLCLDGHRLLTSAPGSLINTISVAIREVRIHDAVLYVDLPAFDEEAPMDLAELNRALNHHTDPCVIGVHADDAHRLVAVSGYTPLAITPLNRAQRCDLWRGALSRHGLPHPDDLDALAARFPLPRQGILDAAAHAARDAQMRDEDLERLETAHLSAHLHQLAARTAERRLSSLAERVESSLRWSDIVLPDDTFEALMEVITFARYRDQVLDQWGFRRKLPYGRALSALFHGPPGTGKTMVAGIIARELGKELFRVDLSQLVSKYIGETEKNIARLFEEARRHDAVLLFDEADALFGKRTQAKSSVDRYANMNVNYLLQAMEAYEGVILMTTNFEGALDDAFKRRIRFHIEFAFPDDTQRAHLWRALIPRQAPVEEDIEFKALGKSFEMSGGHIKDAVLRAAFMAAERGASISTDILMEAGVRVYRELGHLIRL